MLKDLWNWNFLHDSSLPVSIVIVIVIHHYNAYHVCDDITVHLLICSADECTGTMKEYQVCNTEVS